MLIRQSKLAYSKISQFCDQTFGTYFGQETPKNRKFDTQPLSAVILGLRDPLWPEIFETLAVGLTFYALQNGQQFFLKFDP